MTARRIGAHGPIGYLTRFVTETVNGEHCTAGSLCLKASDRGAGLGRPGTSKRGDSPTRETELCPPDPQGVG